VKLQDFPVSISATNLIPLGILLILWVVQDEIIRILINGKVQVGITIQEIGILNLGMAEAGEDVSINNGIGIAVSKLGIADSFLSIKPVAL
jgi:hypothetical protein